MIRAVAHTISTVQKSGINKKMKYSKALKAMKISKNFGEFISHFFLVSQLAKNITYANLKNSEG